MYTPVSISLKNFMSYQNQFFQFNTGSCTLITGTNKDATDTDRSNGSGKSTVVVDATYFAITGDSLRGLKVSDMVRRGEVDGSVEFVMRDAATGKNVIINRHISTTKTSKVTIQEDEESVDAISVLDAGKMILEMLRLSKDDIKNCFIISKDTYEPFFSLTDSKLKGFINSLSNINEVDIAFESIKSKVKSQVSGIASEEHHSSEIKGAISLLEKRITDADPDGQLEEIEAQNEADRQEVVLKTRQHAEMTPYIKTLEDKRDAIDTDHSLQGKIDDLEKDNVVSETALKSQRAIRQKVASKIADAEIAYSNAESQLSGSIECPKCTHEFVLNSDIDELKRIVATNKALYNKLLPMRGVVDKKIEETQLGIKASINSISEFEKLKRRQSQEMSLLAGEIRQAENSKNSLFSEITSLEKLVELRIAGIKKTAGGNSDQNDLEELMGQLTTKEEKVVIMREDLLETQKYEERFKAFKNYLTRKVITTLEIKVNEELKAINPDLMVRMTGFSENSKGKVSEKIEAIVLQSGEFIGNYRTLSGGEKASLNLASIVATNKISLELSEGGGLDMLAIDEILESVDPEGMDRCLSYLSNLEKTISVISHAPSNKNIDGIIDVKVEKFNKISKIV